MISVLIPTKNEPLINKLVKEIHRVLKNVKHEVIVIDKSDISPKVEGAKLLLQESDGLGKAILEGLEHARGKVIITMDGDFSHDPNDIPKLLEEVNKYDIVIGSRFVEGGETEDTAPRKILSFVFRKLASLLLGLRIKDSMSGFAAVKKEVYENLKLDPIGYKINLEIMFKGKKKGYRICEVPITFHKRRGGKTKAGLMEGLRTLWFIFKIRISTLI